MNIYEVIMAGGSGTRFWPLSRHNRPKQLINITGQDIMLNETIFRMDGVIDREHVYIVTNQEQKPQVQELLTGGIPFSNILAEPVGRNTAPAILYAASVLQKEKGDGVMCVFSADHHIQDVTEYRRVIKEAIRCAQEGEDIVTIGIKPTYPATGYGYIRAGEKLESGANKVECFVEKPTEKKAQEYIESGRYTWNSGVFVFKTSTILNAFKQLLPKMCEGMERIVAAYKTQDSEEVLAREYPFLESISIDYGIMEHSKNVVVLEGDYGWSDVGSLDALGTILPSDAAGNTTLGDVLVLDSKGCIAKGNDRLLTLIGVEDLIVVDTLDTVLVCKKECAQDVKRVVELLKKNGRTGLL